MRKVLFLIILQCLMLAACNRVDPKLWNAKVVDAYTKITVDIHDFEEWISLELVGDSTFVKRIEDKGNQISESLEQYRLALTFEEIPEGAEEYRDAVLSFLESVEKQLNVGLEFSQFTENTSDDIIEDYASRYDSLSAETAVKAEHLKEAQSDFIETLQ